MNHLIKHIIINSSLILVLIQAACNQVDTMGVTIQKGKIVSGFVPLPDASIDMHAMEKHLNAFPERWRLAFDFMANSDLNSLALGRIDLSKDVYATISEYQTKSIEETKFESHRKYIDLQYLVLGEENIGLTANDGSLEATPYSEERDISFYTFNGGDLLKATPDSYFIFFPSNLHRPCIDPGVKKFVRKIVVKIKYE